MPITRRSFPTFQLTQSTAIRILRKGKGEYIAGIWQSSPETEVVLEANVQPMQFKEIMLLPESERTKEWIKIYSVEPLRTGNESNTGWEADIVEWDGEKYRVMKCRRYQMGVLDHYHSIAARETVSAGMSDET